jgi:hypothetical protein
LARKVMSDISGCRAAPPPDVATGLDMCAAHS